MIIPELVEGAWVSIDPIRRNRIYSTADQHIVMNITSNELDTGALGLFDNIIVDCSIAEEIGQYQDDLNQLISNMRAVLADGGNLAVVTPSDVFDLSMNGLLIVNELRIEKFTFVQYKKC
jgi:hypothetical protein